MAGETQEEGSKTSSVQDIAAMLLKKPSVETEAPDDTEQDDQSPSEGSGHDLVIRKRNLAIDELAKRGLVLRPGFASAKGGATRDTAAAGAGLNSGRAASVGGQQVGGARIAIGRGYENCTRNNGCAGDGDNHCQRQGAAQTTGGVRPPL